MSETRCPRCGSDERNVRFVAAKASPNWNDTCIDPWHDASPEVPTITHVNRHGERCSTECGEGRHQDCAETYETCHCTYRGLHKSMHAYATIPEPVQAHSMSEYRRIKLQGGNVNPPDLANSPPAPSQTAPLDPSIEVRGERCETCGHLKLTGCACPEVPTQTAPEQEKELWSDAGAYADPVPIEVLIGRRSVTLRIVYWAICTSTLEEAIQNCVRCNNKGCNVCATTKAVLDDIREQLERHD